MTGLEIVVGMLGYVLGVLLLARVIGGREDAIYRVDDLPEGCIATITVDADPLISPEELESMRADAEEFCLRVLGVPLGNIANAMTADEQERGK